MPSGRSVETSDGSYLGIEVKTAGSVDKSDARGLESFARASGAKFRRGLILYTGDTVDQLADDLWAVPLSALWM